MQYVLKCEKCGAKQIVHVPPKGGWHLECTEGGTNHNPPRMVLQAPSPPKTKEK